MSLDWWPKFLRLLVEHYGPETVQAIGLESLGYPPAWVHTYAETRIVEAAIKHRQAQALPATS